MKYLALVACLPLVCLGCAENGDSPMKGSKGNLALQTIELGDRIAFVDTSQERVFVVDPGESQLVAKHFATHRSPLQAEKRLGKNQLLVLSAGQLEEDGEQAQPTRLTLYDPIMGNSPVSLDLPGRFTRFAQSSDGKFAILYYGESNTVSGGGGLYNPNDLAVVDWDKGMVHTRSIGSLGSKPREIVFSPRTTLFGRERTLAVVLASNYLTLFEVDAQADGIVRTVITIPLAPGGKNVMPQKILFDMERPAIFVLAEGSDDIFQISLDATTATSKGNDFRASLTLIGVGAVPSDAAFYGPTSDQKLLVVSPRQQQIVAINPSTGQSTFIPAPIAVDRVYVFKGKSPRDSKVEDRAFLVNQSARLSTVMFADLATIENAPSLAVESWTISSAVGEVTLLSQGLALLTQKNTNSQGEISLVNLEDRTFPPIESGGRIVNTWVETGARDRLWTTSDNRRLNYVDLVNPDKAALVTGEVVLDSVPSMLIPLPKASSDGHRYLVVGKTNSSNSPSFGDITILDADAPTRKTARSLKGFLLTDSLERGQP